MSKNQESFGCGVCRRGMLSEGAALSEVVRALEVYDGIVPERAASMENPRAGDGALNFGGSTRVNGDAVRRRLRIPMRLRVGERPAGADSGVGLEEREVLSFGAGERAVRIGRRGTERGVGLRALEKSFGDGGALVRK
jgi:hypothetical protein